MTLKSPEGHLIAKHGPDGIMPITFVHGDRDAAEWVASRMPSWFILGRCDYNDHREEDSR